MLRRLQSSSAQQNRLLSILSGRSAAMIRTRRPAPTLRLVAAVLTAVPVLALPRRHHALHKALAPRRGCPRSLLLSSASRCSQLLSPSASQLSARASLASWLPLLSLSLAVSSSSASRQPFDWLTDLRIVLRRRCCLGQLHQLIPAITIGVGHQARHGTASASSVSTFAVCASICTAPSGPPRLRQLGCSCDRPAGRRQRCRGALPFC